MRVNVTFNTLTEQTVLLVLVTYLQHETASNTLIPRVLDSHHQVNITLDLHNIFNYLTGNKNVKVVKKLQRLVSCVENIRCLSLVLF